VTFILSIRILAGMAIQRFVVPLDSAGPATLRIEPAERGHRIYIVAEDGTLRAWFAWELIGLRFE
jgi:hypothetical protein